MHMLGRKVHNGQPSQKGFYLRRDKLSRLQCRALQWPPGKDNGTLFGLAASEIQPSMIFVLFLPFGGRCSHSSSPLGWLCAGTSSAVPEEVQICNFPLLLLIKCQHSGDLQGCLFPLSPLGPKKTLFFIPCSEFTW